MKRIKIAFTLYTLVALATSSSATLLIDDDFSSGSVLVNSHFTNAQIDGGWYKRSGANGPDWTIAAGVLTNSAAVANDEKPAFLLNTVSGTDTNLTAISVSFDYTVGAGSTLYFHSALMTGATNGTLNAGTTTSDGGYQGTGFSLGFVGGSLNLKDGSTPANTSANAIASFAANTSGTFSNSYTISGFSGISSIADVSHILAAFASDTDASGGGISIDNFQLIATNAAPVPEASRPAQPNFMLILADDLGWQDLRVYDNDAPITIYETPHLDALATQGVRFTQGYSPAQVCAPSRAGFMGGIYPARQQFTSVSGGIPPAAKDASADRMMPPYYSLRMEDDIISLPEALSSNGYFSGHIGKWHIGGENKFPEPLDQGFDWSEDDRGISFNMERNGETRYTDFATTNAADAYQLQDINGVASTNGFAFDQTTQNGMDFMTEALATNKPFFCFYSTWLVHFPIQMRTERLLEKYAGLMGYPYPLTGSEDLTPDGQINPFYAAMVESFDYHVHQLMTYLEETDDPRWPGHKLIENTYVFFTSDNGGNTGPDTETYTDNYPLREGKKFIDEGGTRVPFMVWGPGIATNVVSDVMVNGLDLYPTMLSLAGLPIPDRLDGYDLSSMLLNDPQNAALVTNAVGMVRDTMFWHSPHGRFRSNIRKDGWKLIKNWDHIDNPEYEAYSLFQLYDTNGVRKDIEEDHDLYLTETNMVTILAAELEAWLVEVDAAPPHYNPDYSGTLPNQNLVPAILDDDHANGVAWITWENNKAEVAKVELLYSFTDENNAVKNGEWFDLDVPFTASSGQAQVAIPEGITHYLWNLIDTNNFLISSDDVAYVPSFNLPTQDAVLTQVGTNFPSGDILIANENGTTAAARVDDDDLGDVSVAAGQTFTVTNGVTMTKLSLKVAQDVTYGSGTHKMALWIGSYSNGTPDISQTGTKVFEWIDLADTTITNNSFITIDFSDVVFDAGTYAFQLAWPSNNAAYIANFYRSASDEYAGGEILKKNADAAGSTIYLPFSQQGTASRDLVFALHGEPLSAYVLWSDSFGLHNIYVGSTPELNTVSNRSFLLREDVGFYKTSNSTWTVANGILGNATSVADETSEGAIAQIFNLGNYTNLASSQLSLSFDYNTAESGEELFVHLWGYEDTMNSSSTTTVMNLAARRGRAWESASPDMTPYNLGHAQGEFTGPAGPGDDADAAAALTGSTGAQVYSNIFDFAGFTNGLSTVADYDYLVLGFARDTVSGSAIEIKNIVIEVIGGDTILSFVQQPGTDLTADPDLDSWNNLLEYALGGNPTNAMDVGIAPEVQLSSSNEFEYIFVRRSDAAARGLSYIVERGTNLLGNAWSTNGTQEVGSGDIGGGFQRVTNRIQSADTAFGRLKIEAIE